MWGQIHAREIIEKMLKSGCSNRQAFEWLSQLRLYWEEDDCAIRQTNTRFNYGYEYLGNSGRLVITPLTDRCMGEGGQVLGEGGRMGLVGLGAMWEGLVG